MKDTTIADLATTSRGVRGGTPQVVQTGRGPTIDRAGSSGDIWTPKIFIDAVERKFGKLDWDLAATAESAKANLFILPATDSLTVDWHRLPVDQSTAGGPKPLLWLNPPFANIAPWARKCAEESAKGAEILLLVPGSIGANWYWDWVHSHADVYSVGRMVFDNCFDRKTGKPVTTPYAKDLILCHYRWWSEDLHTGSSQVIQRWRWQDE